MNKLFDEDDSNNNNNTGRGSIPKKRNNIKQKNNIDINNNNINNSRSNIKFTNPFDVSVDSIKKEEDNGNKFVPWIELETRVKFTIVDDSEVEDEELYPLVAFKEINYKFGYFKQLETIKRLESSKRRSKKFIKKATEVQFSWTKKIRRWSS